MGDPLMMHGGRMNDAQCMVDGIMEGMGKRGHKINMDMDVYYFQPH